VLEGTLELLEAREGAARAARRRLDSLSVHGFATTGAMAAPASSEHCGWRAPQFTTGKEGCGVNAPNRDGKGVLL